MIPQAEFAARRQQLAERFNADAVIVIPAAREQVRSRDTDYPFRQDSDFFYLTGFNEPDAALVLCEGQSILFCREKDPQAEIWHGRRLGPDAAISALGMDEAYCISELDDALVELLNGKAALVYAMAHQAWADKPVLAALQTLRDAPKQTKRAPNMLLDPRSELHEMRLFKSDAELMVMRKAAQISAQAHARAMQACGRLDYEYQLEAEILHEFAMQGARHPAYSTIVGSGDNACILHYTENNSTLKAGDLVLIDAGCELFGYAADITRTFPVSGQFSPKQRALYQLVLDAQHAALEVIKPGSNLVSATNRCIQVLVEGLVNLGLLQGEPAKLIEAKAYRQFFMHGLGHWLGLDVHDVGDYKVCDQDRPFAPGMVLTVEPGLYIATDADVDPKWRGIGIRIEDNVLITADGHENLTFGVPKRIDAIEALMAG